ncbi:MAG: hypothetical protein ABJV04_20720 [Aliiglaciecola sp.]|uniref:RipA family octameric membrane protein n=1 Tax=Aliiglaciecola sp. TaxID=1872441 RepID=UPI003296F83C
MDANLINQILCQNNELESYETREQFNSHLLEQYKLYLNSAENISNRRQTANAFFVTLNTVIISLVSYLNLGTTQNSALYWIVAIAGIVISYMWYRLIVSYRDLNTAKFKVVHEIEKMLPLRPYDAEWQAVGRGEKPALYLPFTHIEVFIPWVFLFLHLIVLSITVLPKILNLIG